MNFLQAANLEELKKLHTAMCITNQSSSLLRIQVLNFKRTLCAKVSHRLFLIRASRQRFSKPCFWSKVDLR